LPRPPLMSTHRLSESDDGRLVTVQPGDEILVELTDISTTGYAWAMDPAPGGCIRLRSINIAPPSTHLVGGHGTCQVSFDAIAPGKMELRLKLWREWVGDTSITKRVTIPVEVRGE